MSKEPSPDSGASSWDDAAPAEPAGDPPAPVAEDPPRTRFLHGLGSSWQPCEYATVDCFHPCFAQRWDHSTFVIIDVMSCLAGAPMGEGIRGAMAAAGLLAQDGYFFWDECNRFLSGLQQARNSQVWGSLALKDVV